MESGSYDSKETVTTGITVPPLPEHIQHIDKPRVLPLVKAIAMNIDKEINQWKRIPCAESSICCGMLTGGMISGYSILKKRSLRAIHHGFVAFIITSIISWNYCRFQLNSSIQVGIQSMHQILEQKHQMYNKKDS